MFFCFHLLSQLFISAVISRNMEKQKHKPSVLRHSFSWVYSPATKELYFTQAVAPEEKVVKGDEESGEGEEFLSVKSCFSQTFHGVQAWTNLTCLNIGGAQWFRSFVIARDGLLVSAAELCCFHHCPCHLLSHGCRVKCNQLLRNHESICSPYVTL